MQGMHEFVRCMTSVEGKSKVVVVGDNGAAQCAETSHQLANALSLSVWDFADSAAPVLTTLVTNQQVGYLLFCTDTIAFYIFVAMSTIRLLFVISDVSG